MDAVASELDAISAISGPSTAPFAEVVVTLTKLEHIELVMEARSWKSLHQRAVQRLQQRQDSTKRFVAQLREHAERREATLHCDRTSEPSSVPEGLCLRARPTGLPKAYGATTRRDGPRRRVA